MNIQQKNTIKYIGLGLLLTLLVSSGSVLIYLQLRDATSETPVNTSGFDWNFESPLGLSLQMHNRTKDLIEIRVTYGMYINMQNGFGVYSEDPSYLAGNDTKYSSLFALRRYENGANTYVSFDRWTDQGQASYSDYVSNNTFQPLHMALQKDLQEVTGVRKVWDRQIEKINGSYSETAFYNRIANRSRALILEHRYNDGSHLSFLIFDDPSLDYVPFQLEFWRYDNLQVSWNQQGEPGAYSSDVIQASVEYYQGNMTAFMPNYEIAFSQVLEGIFAGQ